MPLPPLQVAASDDVLRRGFDDIRAELGIEVGFDAAVEGEAAASASGGPRPEAERDLRDLPFVSIDPPGARDLDQAVAIRPRARGGWVVHYAIADVEAFVTPGGATDAAARRRGVTIYLPDRRAPLHPIVLSEGAASLLPGQERQALVWRFELEADGEVVGTGLARARVRNRRAYAYREAQHAIDAGDADETLRLLREVGAARQQLERARGGMSLPVPEQVVESDADGYRLAFRAPLPVEDWNAQISLMTGIAAADVMLATGVGVLRTLPAPAEEEVAVLRRHARALLVPWPAGQPYAAFVAGLDPTVPDQAALAAQAGRLFRGAGYAPFDHERGLPRPDALDHAAVAAPYAHATAPLRRLVDRFANAVVLAAFEEREPAAWVRDALATLPELMDDARRREGAADSRAADLIEAAVLARHMGAVLDAVVVRRNKHGVQVQLRDPAVVAAVDDRAGAGGSGLGDEIRVKVLSVDVGARRVELAVVP